MSLTPEQEALSNQLTNLQRRTVLGVVAGLSQRQAYYEAGGKAKNDAAADTSAYEIMSRPDVQAFYNSLISPVAEKAMLTLESHLQRLEELSNAAVAAGQYSAAIAAETNRGKAAGLYSDKLEVSGPNGGPVPMAPIVIELVSPGLTKKGA